MIDKLLTYKNDNKKMSQIKEEILASNNARLMYYYLYYSNGEDLDLISLRMLNTHDYRYILFLLRTFELKNYSIFVEDILSNKKDSSYLFSCLYDIRYLSEDYQIKLLNKILESDNKYYIFKSIYYYFVIQKKFNNNIFNKACKFCLENFSITLNKNDYIRDMDRIFTEQNKINLPNKYSKNLYKGHKNYIPSIIVCHINNTFRGMIENFYNDESGVSSHYIIRKDGFIKKIVPLEDTSWANGTSLSSDKDVYYKFATSPLINNFQDNANYITYSIEHESFDGTLTDAQIESSVRVMKEIIDYLKNRYNYDFIIDREHIIGHNEINPIVRPNCPGNEFPFDIIIAKLKNK